MEVVLDTFGFGPIFQKWVKILYKSPVAAIKLNRMVSDFFQVSRGTHQECHLSPGLFALMIELLAEALRTSSGVKGICMGSLEEKEQHSMQTIWFFFSGTLTPHYLQPCPF